MYFTFITHIHPLPLFFPNQKISFFESRGDSSNVHYREGTTEIVRGDEVRRNPMWLLFLCVVDEGKLVHDSCVFLSQSISGRFKIGSLSYLWFVGVWLGSWLGFVDMIKED